MKPVFFDTNVLVAACVATHPHHQPSRTKLAEAQQGKIQGVISSQIIAETYAVLTTLPLTPAILPATAGQLIDENLREFRRIHISSHDYDQALQRTIDRNLRGNLIFDSLILQACLREKISTLLTWNERDFLRLSGAAEIKIIHPED